VIGCGLIWMTEHLGVSALGSAARFLWATTGVTRSFGQPGSELGRRIATAWYSVFAAETTKAEDWKHGDIYLAQK
jgi:hypothetical protein